jgi:hypothetical protein
LPTFGATFAKIIPVKDRETILREVREAMRQTDGMILPRKSKQNGSIYYHDVCNKNKVKASNTIDNMLVGILIVGVGVL